jgi:hypothetical protein
LGVATNGQLIIGSTGADPVVASITDGEGIDTTGGAGTLTIACEDASTTNKGVTVYSGTTKAIAGTDTASAMTPADTAAAQAVLAREPDQGVNMTAATSGSNGIAVADDDDIDYGTGNFFGVIPVLLADYTPSAEVVLEQKTDGTNGREFTLQTNGKLRVTINTTDYDSTVATGCTDNTKHVFGYSVTRKTAASAGSIIFVVDGVQLGDAVAITAGAPTTINNAVSQYVLGTSATRTAGTVNGYISGNRALTAAEHLALYRNGIAYADKWGSQTAVYTSNFSAGADSWVGGDANVTLTGNTDSIDGEDDWLKVERINTAGRADTSRPATILQNRNYNVAVKINNPVGSSLTHFICAVGGLLGTNTAVAVAAGSTVTTILSCPVVAGGNTTLYVSPSNASGVYAASVAAGQIYYIKAVSTYYAGATLALEPANIQPVPGMWLDSSTNKLHAIYPAAGATITKPKDTFVVKWVNTWAGTHEAQYIGGVNQAVLPANCYIESIIGVITGATIEDIIIGDGSDTDRWVVATTGLTAATYSFALANRISDGTNYKLVVDPDANFTGSIAFTIRGIILQ